MKLQREALALPAVAWLCVFWAWPLLLVLGMSVRDMDPMTFRLEGYTLTHLKDVLADAFYRDSLVRTIRIAALATFLAAVIGYPVALHVSRTRSERLRAAYTLILLVPIMISLVVTGFAWILVLGPNGFLNQLIMAVGISSTPLQFLNSESGVVAVLVYSFGPYMIINICTAIDKIDPAIQRAAQVHGASAWQSFYRVTLPLSFPGILSGALIVFSLSAAAFVTPYIIGGNRVKVVPLQIYNAAVTTFDWPKAAALSVVLFAIAMLFTSVIARWSERRFAAWLR